MVLDFLLYQVLEAVLKLLTASRTMFFLDYWPFAKRYGPNVVFVESLLRARDDLDRKQVTDIVSTLNLTYEHIS